MSNIPESLQVLKDCEGHRYAQWLGGVLPLDPELDRALKVIAALVGGADSKTHRKSIHAYIGHAKCPSSASCQKLAYRAQIIRGWVSDAANPVEHTIYAGVYALERFLPACEGADDRHQLFKPAVRQLISVWLGIIAKSEVSEQLKSQVLFQTMLLDQCSLVEPVWWWNAIAATDADAALRLASQTIESLPELEPSSEIRWKSYTQRWVRMRLKGFLEHVGQTSLLAELMRKSAIDDFEAAYAVRLMSQLGQGRDALHYGERWMRAMPQSPVLAEEMVQLYRKDGWDEEARQLAEHQYQRDPHPRWLAYLNNPV